MPVLTDEGDVIRHLTVSAKRLQPVAAAVSEYHLFLIKRAALESKRAKSEVRMQP